MLTKELESLIAKAGRHEADQKRRAYDARAREEQERAEQGAATARAEEGASGNAEALFAWLATAEADELREAMRRHGVERIRLGSPLGIVHGERRPGLGFGTCTLDMLVHAPAFHVTIVRGYHGGQSRLVASAAALAGLVPACVLATVADEVRGGRALDQLHEDLFARACQARPTCGGR